MLHCGRMFCIQGVFDVFVFCTLVTIQYQIKFVTLNTSTPTDSVRETTILASKLRLKLCKVSLMPLATLKHQDNIFIHKAALKYIICVLCSNRVSFLSRPIFLYNVTHSTIMPLSTTVFRHFYSCLVYLDEYKLSHF